MARSGPNGPIISILQRRQIERTPQPRKYEPSEQEKFNRSQQRPKENALRLMTTAATSFAKEAAAQLQAKRMELEAQREANNAREELADQQRTNREHSLALSFAPHRADITSVQALAFNPKYQQLDPDVLWEHARLAEGRRNAVEFAREIDTIPPEQRAALAPLAAGLKIEGMDGQKFQGIVNAEQLDDDSVYDYSIEDRRKANRVIDSTTRGTDVTDLQKMAFAGATPDQLKTAATPRTVAKVPTWSRDEGSLRRWGATAEEELAQYANNIMTADPNINFYDALEQANENIVGIGGERAGKWNDYQKVVGYDTYKSLAATRAIPKAEQLVAEGKLTAEELESIKTGVFPEAMDPNAPLGPKIALTQKLDELYAASSNDVELGGLVSYFKKTSGAPLGLKASLLHSGTQFITPLPGSEKVTEPLGKIPVVGEELERQASGLLTPIGIGATVSGVGLAPKLIATGIAGSTAAGVGGQYAEEKLGAPTHTRTAAEVLGGFYGGGTGAGIVKTPLNISRGLSNLALNLNNANRLKLSPGIQEFLKKVATSGERGAFKLPKDIWYHGTVDTKVPQIQADGFTDVQGRGVFLTKNPDEALRYAQKAADELGGEPQVIPVRVRERPLNAGETPPTKKDVGKFFPDQVEAIDEGRFVLEQLEANNQLNDIGKQTLQEIRQGGPTAEVPQAKAPKKLTPRQQEKADAQALADERAPTSGITPEGEKVTFAPEAEPSAAPAAAAPEATPGELTLKQQKEADYQASVRKTVFDTTPDQARAKSEKVTTAKGKTKKTPTGASAVASAEDAAEDAALAADSPSKMPPAEDATAPPAAPPKDPVATTDGDLPTPPTGKKGIQKFIHALGIKLRTTNDTVDSLAAVQATVVDDAMRAAVKGGSKAIDDADGDLASFGVKPKTEGLSTFYDDVYENLDAYDMPDALRAAIKAHITSDVEALRPLADLGIIPSEWLDNAHSRRLVVKVGDTDISLGPRPGIGTKPGYMFSRSYETTEAARKAGVKYYNSPAGKTEILYREVGRQISAHQFAKDMGLNPKGFLKILGQNEGDIHRAYGQAVKMREALGFRTTKAPAAEAKLVRQLQNKAKSATQGIARAKDRITALKKVKPSQRGAPWRKSLAAAEKKLANAEERLAAAEAGLPDARAARKAGRDITSQAHAGETRLNEPFAGGWIVSKETADAIRSEFGKPTGLLSHTLNALAGFNDLFTPIWAGADLSNIGLQNAAAFAANPVGTSAMIGRAMASVTFDERAYSSIVSAKIDTIRDMVNHGVPWYSDAAFALDGNVTSGQKVVSKIPLVNKVYAKTNAYWNRSINLSALDQWENGLRSIADAGELPVKAAFADAFPNIVAKSGARTAKEQFAAVISHYAGRMAIPESAAMRPLSNLAMRAIPFAGRYWAGWGKAIGDLVTGGHIGQRRATRLMLGWVLGGTGLYSTASLLMGQEPILNPIKDGKFNPQFMTVRIGDARVGIGGPLQQMMTLAARMASDPKNAHGIAAKWTRGKTSPSIAILADLVTGRTFTGEKVDFTDPRSLGPYVTSRVAPFIAQDTINSAFTSIANGDEPGEAWEDIKRSLWSAPGTGLGFRAYPVSPYEKMDEAVNKLVDEGKLPPEVEGKKYNDLLPEHKAIVEAATPKVQNQLERERGREASLEDITATTFAQSDKAAEATQKQLDDAGDQLNKGNLTHAEYREVVNSIEEQSRGRRDMVESLFTQAGISLGNEEIPYAEPKDPYEQTFNDLWEYYNIFEKYPNAVTNPDEKNAMFEDIESFRLGIGDEREAAMDRNLGIKKGENEVWSDLRDDRRVIRESGYWDIPQEVWDIMYTRAKGKLPETYDEYADEKRNMIAGELEEVLPGQSSAAFDVFLAKDPVIKAYNTGLTELRKQWALGNKEAARLVVKWEYNKSQYMLATQAVE